MFDAIVRAFAWGYTEQGVRVRLLCAIVLIGGAALAWGMQIVVKKARARKRQ